MSTSLDDWMLSNKGLTYNDPKFDPSCGAITASRISANGYVGTVTTIPKISANEIDINGISLADTLAKIQERLAILVPDPKLLEKYAALQDLYSQYKMMEALLNEDK